MNAPAQPPALREIPFNALPEATRRRLTDALGKRGASLPIYENVQGKGGVVGFAVLALLFKGGFASFVTAQAVATFVAMTGNFVLNNWLTYRDRRLKGWGWLRGWISFTLVCSVGALANVGLAGWLFREHSVWWGASAVAGVLIGAVWNYAVTAVYTWNRKG